LSAATAADPALRVGGRRAWSFAVAPQAGTVDGVNEKGVAITLGYAFVTDSGTPHPLSTLLIADALASCASVTEVFPSLTRSKTTAQSAVCQGNLRQLGIGLLNAVSEDHDYPENRFRNRPRAR
jgi:hypothetical protein